MPRRRCRAEGDICGCCSSMCVACQCRWGGPALLCHALGRLVPLHIPVPACPGFLLPCSSSHASSAAPSRSICCPALSLPCCACCACRRQVIEVGEIDTINILQATLKAMEGAAAGLPTQPDYLLVDGNRLPKVCTAAGMA